MGTYLHPGSCLVHLPEKSKGVFCMAQKLITFAVPCYNSAAYMRHCIETLLSAGEQAESILVDDASTKDGTPAICDGYATK